MMRSYKDKSIEIHRQKLTVFDTNRDVDSAIELLGLSLQIKSLANRALLQNIAASVESSRIKPTRIYIDDERLAKLIPILVFINKSSRNPTIHLRKRIGEVKANQVLQEIVKGVQERFEVLERIAVLEKIPTWKDDLLIVVIDMDEQEYIKSLLEVTLRHGINLNLFINNYPVREDDRLSVYLISEGLRIIEHAEGYGEVRIVY
jgi:hypothetical protein